MSSPSVKRSSPMATLSPLNLETARMLNLRHNATKLSGPSPWCRGASAASIDLAAFAGRRFLSLGSSRWTVFKFPKKHGIDESHIVLSFDMCTARLVLTDTSNSGTWVAQDADLAPMLLHNASIVVDGSINVRFPNASFAFNIDAVCTPPVFEAYATTLGKSISYRRASCRAIRKSQAPGQKLVHFSWPQESRLVPERNRRIRRRAASVCIVRSLLNSSRRRRRSLG